VNIAYKAATADLGDVNMIDPFHLDAYGTTAVNYNCDVEIFPVLNAMLEQILGVSPYKSPTDMGMNMAGCCIIDDEAVCDAAKKEIIRRYYTALCDVKRGKANSELAMEQLDRLRGCDAHSTVILSERDVNTFKQLGVNLTCEPKYETKRLFNK